MKPQINPHVISYGNSLIASRSFVLSSPGVFRELDGRFSYKVKLHEFPRKPEERLAIAKLGGRFRRFVDELECIVGLGDELTINSDAIFTVELDYQIPIHYWTVVDKLVVKALEDSFDTKPKGSKA